MLMMMPLLLILAAFFSMMSLHRLLHFMEKGPRYEIAFLLKLRPKPEGTPKPEGLNPPSRVDILWDGKVRKCVLWSQLFFVRESSASIKKNTCVYVKFY